MNYITTQQEMIDYLREFFKVFNNELYLGKLHDPVINVGTLGGAQKSRYVPYVWNDARGKRPEIMFDPSFLGDETTAVADIAVELLHCMAHQYCDEHRRISQ